MAEAGTDASIAFEDVGHSDEARELLNDLYVDEFEGEMVSNVAGRFGSFANS